MGSDLPVTPEEAAISLAKVLQHEPWFLTVGLGQETGGEAVLFVYAKSVKAARMTELREWKGYKVFIKSLTARPAADSRNPPKHHTHWL